MNYAGAINPPACEGVPSLPPSFCGCRQHGSEGKTTPFVLVAPQAEKVFIAGSMNGWNTTSISLQRDATGCGKSTSRSSPTNSSSTGTDAGPGEQSHLAGRFWRPQSHLIVSPGRDESGPVFKNALAAKAHQLFLAEHFAALEKEATHLWKTRAHMPDGVWQLAVYSNGLNADQYWGIDPKSWADAMRSRHRADSSQPPRRSAATRARARWI